MLTRKFHFACTGIVMLLATFSTAQTGVGTWIPRANMPILRGEASGALVGNRIYMVGGFSNSGSGAPEVQIYTPSTNAWSVAAKLPVGLHHANVGAAGGKLYVLGGCDHGRRPDPGPNNSPWLGSYHAFEYNPALDTWRKLKPLPHSTAAGGVAFWGGKLYLIGGVDTLGFQLNLVQEYDPITETWRLRAPMSMAREHFGIAVLDSLIYVVAGRQTGLGGISVTTFETYNPARNEWKVLPSLPTARSGLGFAAAKGRLYAMGGEWPGTFDANEEYNPVTNSWRTVAKMPAAVHGFSAVTYQDTVFSLGTVNPAAAYLPSQATSILVAPNTATNTRPPSLMSSSWLGIFNGRIFNGLGIEREK